MKKFIKPAVLALGLLSITGQAFAHLSTGGVVIDFEDGDAPGLGPMLASVQPAFAGFYLEEGVIHSAIGFDGARGSLATIGNFGAGGSHIHGFDTGGSRVSQLAPDAGGGFFELFDHDAFSVQGMDVAGLMLNQLDGTKTTLTLRGYSDANFTQWTDVILGGGDNGSSVTSINGDFLTETGAGINGTHIHLDDIAEFGSVYLFEYFFDASGRGVNPAPNFNNNSLLFEMDNVEFGTVSSVPVPAAAYLFASALLGLGSLRRKKVV